MAIAAMTIAFGASAALAADGLNNGAHGSLTNSDPVQQRDSKLPLKLGSGGEAVAAVEHRLVDLGFQMHVDGYFDKATERAVRSFQRRAGLEVEGIVGATTWGALFADAVTGASRVGGGASLDVAGGKQTGQRFAIRLAGRNELHRSDLGQLGRSATSNATPSGGNGAFVAIDIEDRPFNQSEVRPPAAANGAEPTDMRPGTSGREDGSESSGSQPTAPTPPTSSGVGTAACGSGRLVTPVTGAVLTSGYRTAARPSHAGVDLAAPAGTPIHAVACGIVSFLQGTAQTGGYGNLICVKHTDRFTTCYAHLSRFAAARVGDFVRQGEIIGYVGSTGHSTGPHLHF